jgi:L-threonylcarbamoyladenylate synthase
MSGSLSWHLQGAVQALALGEVIACPTEAVWGLSCDPAREDAVAKLLRMKQRSVAKGLILVAADEAQIEGLLASLSPAQRSKLSLSWPGPSTWLVPHNNLLPPWIHGDFDSVAVRVSAHPVVSALCRAWGGPLVSSSANRSGCRAAQARFQVQRYFGEQLAAVLPGNIDASLRPSVIRHAITDEVVRC